MENKELEKILKWGEMPYRKLPLELPEHVQKLADDGFINLRDKKLTVLDVYFLVVLAEKLKKGDMALLEQLVGKAGIRAEKPQVEQISELFPDQGELLKKYNRSKSSKEVEEVWQQ